MGAEAHLVLLIYPQRDPVLPVDLLLAIGPVEIRRFPASRIRADARPVARSKVRPRVGFACRGQFAAEPEEVQRDPYQGVREREIGCDDRRGGFADIPIRPIRGKRRVETVVLVENCREDLMMDI